MAWRLDEVLTDAYEWSAEERSFRSARKTEAVYSASILSKRPFPDGETWRVHSITCMLGPYISSRSPRERSVLFASLVHRSRSICRNWEIKETQILKEIYMITEICYEKMRLKIASFNDPTFDLRPVSTWCLNIRSTGCATWRDMRLLADKTAQPQIASITSGGSIIIVWSRPNLRRITYCTVGC